MNKPFSNLINSVKDKDLTSSEKITNKKGGEKSKPLIIFGFLISLSSILLLLYTINYNFG